VATQPDLPVELFTTLVQFAPDALIVVDQQGTIVFANTESERLFGYPRDELLGMRVERLVPEGARPNHVGDRERYFADPQPRPMGIGLDLTARRRDGSPVPVEISLSSVASGSTHYVLAAVRDVTEQRRLEDQRRLLLADAEIERERERIAADLHDGVMQTMYSVGLQLSSVVRRVTDLPESTRDELREAITALDAAIGDIRRYVMDLRPADFSGNLGESLTSLAGLFESTSGIRTTLDVAGDLPAVDEALGVELFLLAREAVSNVRRHAHASTVTLSLRADAGTIRLEIADDGAGFDPSQVRRTSQFGLRNMETRARMMGGSLTLTSQPGEGTTVCVEVPATGRR